MKVTLVAGFFFILIQSIDCGEPVVFCDDIYGKYTAVAGNLMLSSYEFPIMSTVTGSKTLTVSDLTIPKMLHPCYSLSNGNNYKNQLFDIFSYGKFAQSVCARQCVHYVDAFRFECGDRRPPPTWLVGSSIGANRKINCSDWDIPLTPKGIKDGISLTILYGTFQASNGLDVTPPYTLDEKSIKYLDDKFIKGLHIKPVVDPAKEKASLDEMEIMLEQFVDKHPEISHIAFGNPISFFGDTFRNDSKLYAPRFKPTDKFWTALSNAPNLKSVSLSMIEITGKETILDSLTEDLQSIGFYDVKMSSVPSWIQSEQLQFLEFQISLSDSTDISVLDELPGLEHFILTDSTLTSIKSPFLAKSTELISLTLQCNAINSIASGAFDHLANLKFLNLAGNRLVNLPDNLLINIDNLLVLDLKTIDNQTSYLQSFDEQSMSCQTKLTPVSSPPLLESMPTVSNPETILGLDIRGQTTFLKQDKQLLENFKNLEVLNLGNLGLSSIQNLSLESLCNLNDLNLVGNPLDSKEWIGDDIFINLNLQQLRIGTPYSMTMAPNSLVAFMRTASQIMYSTPISLNYVAFYRYKTGCDYDTMTSATMFGYSIQNVSCESHVHDAIEKIRTMELLKMDSKCL